MVYLAVVPCEPKYLNGTKDVLTEAGIEVVGTRPDGILVTAEGQTDAGAVHNVCADLIRHHGHDHGLRPKIVFCRGPRLTLT